MIYLDYQATTPLAPEARAAMMPWLEDRFGNPHSPHRMGREAAAAIEAARVQILAALSPVAADNGRLVFTGGATEALNWALKGAAARNGRKRGIVFAADHSAVLATAGWLDRQGIDMLVLPVGRDGLIDEDAAIAAIDERVAFIVITTVNNETGVIQQCPRLADHARELGVWRIADAVQQFGKTAVIPVERFDLIAISAHKMHGPKGIGALWLRNGFDPEPLLHGGGQEIGLRSGTLSPALCVGFGVAARLSTALAEADALHVADLRERALQGLGPAWTINGHRDQRFPGNINVRRDGLDAGRLISDLRDLAFSAGSACASGSGRPSHVLRAIGLSDAEARSSIRLGFGRYTKALEIDEAMGKIEQAARRQAEWA